uniref:Uncharacterized protein n=1 Tax=Vespula pensylvanica TaxID=30213 RepID=A0A834UAC5_VESPE|nr:hypothetical protein H0235_008257 [Vespula pensylvanica]
MEYTIIIKPSEKYHDFNDKCWTTIIGRTLYIVRLISKLSLKHYEIEQIHENFVNGYTTSLLLRDAMNALKPDSLLDCAFEGHRDEGSDAVTSSGDGDGGDG